MDGRRDCQCAHPRISAFSDGLQNRRCCVSAREKNIWRCISRIMISPDDLIPVGARIFDRIARDLLY
jgi:hypothetical protein